jgi:hypothetical protein
MGRAREKRAGRAAAELGWAKNRIEEDFLFFFLFQVFKAFSQNDLESSFEFNSNHSTQKLKCSSMNAQSCFYLYI